MSYPRRTRRHMAGWTQWEIDSYNGGEPTARERGWDGTKFNRFDNPGGRFEGKKYPTPSPLPPGARPANPEDTGDNEPDEHTDTTDEGETT